MSGELTIMQGDQYALVFAGTENGEPLNTTEIEKIEFSVGTLRKCWPEDVAQDEEGNFLFPLTQEETFSVRTGLVHVQIRVKYAGGGEPKVIGVDLGDLRIAGSMSREVL